MKWLFSPGLLVAFLLTGSGCGGSDRSISLGDTEIVTETPIQLAKDAIPIACSRDGSRIALESEGPAGTITLTVIETDSQQELARTIIPDGRGTIIFGSDREVLYRPDDDGYVAWSYATDSEEVLEVEAPRVPEAGFLMNEVGWNADRSIGILFPDRRRSGGLFGHSPGEIGTAGGTRHEIGLTQSAGFDQYGNAWFGKGNDWTRVDKAGQATKSTSRPEYLTHDQMKDRGSMHLSVTDTEMKYKGAKAYITCVWLTSDRAVPFTRVVEGKTVRIDESYKAAVVFAGADVLEYGFLPGRNVVYILSGFGTYLVPFKIAPMSEH